MVFWCCFFFDVLCEEFGLVCDVEFCECMVEIGVYVVWFECECVGDLWNRLVL